MNTTEPLMAHQQLIQNMVRRFVLDADAIADMLQTGMASPAHWRVHALAVVALHDWVRQCRDGGFLLYLHGDNILFNPTDGAA